MPPLELLLIAVSSPIILLSCWMLLRPLIWKSTRGTATRFWVGTIVTCCLVLAMALMLPNTSQVLLPKIPGRWMTGLVIGVPVWLTLGWHFAVDFTRNDFEEQPVRARPPFMHPEGTQPNRRSRRGMRQR